MHDAGIKEISSTSISFRRSKLLQSCSNFTLKPELEPTVIAFLAGRDVQEVLCTRFVQTLSCHSRRLRFLPDICNAEIHKSTGYNYSKNFRSWTRVFSAKTYTVLSELLNGL